MPPALYPEHEAIHSIIFPYWTGFLFVGAALIFWAARKPFTSLINGITARSSSASLGGAIGLVAYYLFMVGFILYGLGILLGFKLSYQYRAIQ